MVIVWSYEKTRAFIRHWPFLLGLWAGAGPTTQLDECIRQQRK